MEPAPGSDEAIKQGCLCGQAENKRGKGFVLGDNPPIFFKEPLCPIHGAEAESLNGGLKCLEKN